MAKKLKKVKKGLNPKVKFTLTNLFKGIISNQACIDGSRESPWWVAGILLVFSVIVPLLPNFVRLGKTNGAAFISSVNYGLDAQVTGFAYDFKKDGYDIRVEKNTLHYYQNENEKEFIIPDDNYFEGWNQEYSYVNTVTGQMDLRVFFWSGKNLENNVKKLLKQKM